MELFDRERIPFVLMGGLAVNIWGIPRTTFDVDFEIDVPREKLAAFLASADREGFFFEDSFARGFVDQVAGAHPLVVIQRWSGGRSVHIDLFLAETPFLRQVFDRAVTVPVDGVARRVVTAADLILMKLLAWRAKDRADIQNVLAVHGVPEEAYLRSEARSLGVAGRLEEAISEWRAAGG